MNEKRTKIHYDNEKLGEYYDNRNKRNEFR